MCYASCVIESRFYLRIIQLLVQLTGQVSSIRKSFDIGEIESNYIVSGTLEIEKVGMNYDWWNRNRLAFGSNRFLVSWFHHLDITSCVNHCFHHGGS